MPTSAQQIFLLSPSQSAPVFLSVDDILHQIKNLPCPATDPLKVSALQVETNLRLVVRGGFRSLIPRLDTIESNFAGDPTRITIELTGEMEKSLSKLSQSQRENLAAAIGIDRSKFPLGIAGELLFKHGLAAKIIDILQDGSNLAAALDLLSAPEIATMLPSGAHRRLLGLIGAGIKSVARLAVDLGIRLVTTPSRGSAPINYLSSTPPPLESSSVNTPIFAAGGFKRVQADIDNARVKKEPSIWEACKTIGEDKRKEQETTKQKEAQQAEDAIKAVYSAELDLYSKFSNLKEIFETALIPLQHFFIDGPVIGLRRLWLVAEALAKKNGLQKSTVK